jgi:P27 family predicted phage terminase small subunit
MPKKVPSHLKTATKKWWNDVSKSYELEPHHIRLLTLAAEAWDRCAQAREAVDREGLTYTSRLGEIKIRPEVGVERDSRTAFARLLRELALDIEPPPESARPPRAY